MITRPPRRSINEKKKTVFKIYSPFIRSIGKIFSAVVAAVTQQSIHFQSEQTEKQA